MGSLPTRTVELVRASRPEESRTTTVTVYVPLEGLVDFAAERQRISAELARAQEDLGRISKKLANEGFLSKAAPEIIEKDRAKAAELSATVVKLTGQLGELAE